jgi:hypothetical protein
MAALPAAIDPPGCGCTECLTGEYVPLDLASPIHIMALVFGVIANNTGLAIDEIINRRGDG